MAAVCEIILRSSAANIVQVDRTFARTIVRSTVGNSSFFVVIKIDLLTYLTFVILYNILPAVPNPSCLHTTSASQ